MNNNIIPKKLFHGTTELQHKSLIKGVDVNFIGANQRPDFGVGFYLTSNFNQAAKQAQRKARSHNFQLNKMRSNKTIRPIVFEYELIIDPDNSPRCLVFDSPTDEWGNFVLSNRTSTLYGKLHNLDQNIPLVFGPLADGKPNITVLLDDLKKNRITLEDARSGIKPADDGKNLQNQLSIHTVEAQNWLKFRSIKGVDQV